MGAIEDLQHQSQEPESWTRERIEAKAQAELKWQEYLDVLAQRLTDLKGRFESELFVNQQWREQSRKLRERVELLEEVARAAGAIRMKVDSHLQVLNLDHWLGAEMRRLDAALKALGGGG